MRLVRRYRWPGWLAVGRLRVNGCNEREFTRNGNVSRRELIVEKPTSTGNEVMIIPNTRDQEQVGALARWSDLGRS